MHFSIDIPALLGICLLAVAIYVLRLRFKTEDGPWLFYSDVKALLPAQNSWKVQLAPWPKRFMWMGLFAFALAFINPQLLIKKKPHKDPSQENQQKPYFLPTEGIAIYLLLDQSGSMGAEVLAYAPDGSRKQMTKIALVKQETKRFIDGDLATGLRGRANDMIGLIAFARGAKILSPLTLDHAALLSQLSHFQAVGNREQDGTAIGYAIYKAASLIAATRHYSQELIEKGELAYVIKGSVIILITDGLQDPNPLDQSKRLRNIDIPDAAAYAKEQGVRLYIINVEPKMATEALAANRKQMQRSAELTGGKLFLMNNEASIATIYQEIDRLEKSQNLSESVKPDPLENYDRRLAYPYLIFLGLSLLFCGLMLDSTVLRRVP